MVCDRCSPVAGGPAGGGKSSVPSVMASEEPVPSIVVTMVSCKAEQKKRATRRLPDHAILLAVNLSPVPFIAGSLDAVQSDASNSVVEYLNAR